MTISYKETQRNHTLKEYSEPRDIEKRKTSEKLIQKYKKLILELQDSTEKDDIRLLEIYKKTYKNLVKGGY